MKNLSKKMALAMIALLLTCSVSFALGTKEKIVEKAIEAVGNGAPDDWMLLAKQADYLLKRDAGLATAKEWIEKSIALKKDAYNLEVMGDYYVKSNLHKEAIKYYLQSVDAQKVDNPKVDTSRLQNKIMLSKQQM